MFEPVDAETRNLASYFDRRRKREQLLLTALSVKYMVISSMAATHKSVLHLVEQQRKVAHTSLYEQRQ